MLGLPNDFLLANTKGELSSSSLSATNVTLEMIE